MGEGGSGSAPVQPKIFLPPRSLFANNGDKLSPRNPYATPMVAAQVQARGSQPPKQISPFGGPSNQAGKRPGPVTRASNNNNANNNNNNNNNNIKRVSSLEDCLEESTENLPNGVTEASAGLGPRQLQPQGAAAGAGAGAGGLGLGLGLGGMFGLGGLGRPKKVRNLPHLSKQQPSQQGLAQQMPVQQPASVGGGPRGK